MKKNKIISADIEVSCLGLGTVKFGRNEKVKYPADFTLPNDSDILNLLNIAKESGINLIDTAPAYGTSEERIGKLLRNQRKEWVLSTKVGEDFINGESIYDFSKSHINRSVERSLKHLQTDYLDVVLVHSSGEDETIIQEHEVFETLERLKQKGYIRAYGMSTKTVVGGLLTLKYADIAMVTHNLAYNDELSVIEYAHAHKKNVFIKKAFASGHLNQFKSDDPVRDSLQFVLQTAGVTSVIVGTVSPIHLRHNIECAELSGV